MGETQISIRINRALWRQFRAACVLRDTAPTHEIARFVEHQLDLWDKEENSWRIATVSIEEKE